MSLQLSLAVTGNLAEYTAHVAKAVEAGCNAAIRRATFGMRANLRGRVRRGGFRSPGLSKTLAAKVDRSKLEGRVYSVAQYQGGGRTAPFDLIQLFSEGATIRAAGGTWLAIPTGFGPRHSAGRGRIRMATPEEIAGMGWKTAIIPARRKGNMVVLATLPSGTKVVTHVLVKQVSLRPRYNLDAGVTLWQGRIPEVLAQEINKAAVKNNVE